MNCYSINGSAKHWNQVVSDSRLPFNIVLGCLLIIGVLGNSVVVHVCRRKQKGGNRFYVLLLAVLDIVTCIDTVISVIIFNSIGINFPSDVLCKIITYFMWTTPSSSSLMILIIALQRFLLVYRPTKRYLDPRHHRIIVVLIVLLVPLVIAFPMCIFSGTVEMKLTLSDGRNVTKCSCESSSGQHRGTEEGYLVFLFFLTLILIITTALLYIPVGIVIIKKRKESKSPSDSPANSVDDLDTATSDSTDVKTTLREETKKKRKRPNSTLNFHVMFGVIVLTYLLAYIPTFCLLLIQRGHSGFWMEMWGWELTILLIFRRFHLVSNIVNPFVYGYFDITFRNYYLSLLSTVFCRCKSSNYSLSNCNQGVNLSENQTGSTNY
jgi:hypothetical protein